MDADVKKTALRMIPYGLYVLTAENGEGRAAAATVNWVTQTSFDPPLVVNAGLAGPLTGRPDEATLWLKDLGENVFYGG